MVYPACKAPRGRIGKDVGRGGGGGVGGEDPCTAVAGDGDARWQDVSPEGAEVPKSNGLFSTLYDSLSGSDQVEEPPKEHEVGPSREVAGQGARHQPDDQRRSEPL